MNKTSSPVDRIKLGLVMVLLAILTGCVGYVDGGYGAAVVVPEPEVTVFGGFYERGPYVHSYSHRGFESRAAAHPSFHGHVGRR